METSVRIVKEEKMVSVKEHAEENANQRLVELLVPSNKKANNYKNPFEMLFGGGNNQQDRTGQDNSRMI